MPSATGRTGASDDGHPERVVRLASDPARDTFVRLALGPGVVVRLLSQRCQEATAQGLPNQDYSVLLSRREGASLAFCVCDGVGSSYKGDFAAAYLAARLVDCLAALPSMMMGGDQTTPPSVVTGARNCERLREYLLAQLAAWAHSGQEELRTLAMPADVDPLVGEVLAELRDGTGSEAVFLAGRVEFAAEGEGSPNASSSGARPAVPWNGQSAHLALCWMGNVTAQVYSAPDRQEPLCTPSDDRNRWSTARGARGRLEVACATLPELHRLVVHTDGAESFGASIAGLADRALAARAGQQHASPRDDDLTMLDICWDAARSR